jgi:hypothetical protein
MATVNVKFGADTSDLTSELAIAQRQIQLSSNEMRRFADQIIKGGSSADSARAAIASWSAENVAARAKVEELNKELGGTVAGLNRMQGMELGHIGKALFDEMAAGGNVMRALTMEGGRIAQVFGEGSGGVAGTFKALGGMIGITSLASLGAVGAFAALAAAGAYVAYQFAAMHSAIEDLKLTAAVNQVNMTESALRGLIDSIKASADASTSDAAKIAKAFLGIGDGGAEIAKAASSYLPLLAKEMGGELSEAADKLAGMFKDLSGAGLKYVSETKGVSASTIEAYRGFVQAGETGKAYSVIVGAMVSRLEETRSALASKKPCRISIRWQLLQGRPQIPRLSVVSILLQPLLTKNLQRRKKPRHPCVTCKRN